MLMSRTDIRGRTTPVLLLTSRTLRLLRPWNTLPVPYQRTSLLSLLDRCRAPCAGSDLIHYSFSRIRLLGLGYQQLLDLEMGL